MFVSLPQGHNYSKLLRVKPAQWRENEPAAAASSSLFKLHWTWDIKLINRTCMNHQTGKYLSLQDNSHWANWSNKSSCYVSDKVMTQMCTDTFYSVGPTTGTSWLHCTGDNASTFGWGNATLGLPVPCWKQVTCILCNCSIFCVKQKERSRFCFSLVEICPTNSWGGRMFPPNICVFVKFYICLPDLALKEVLIWMTERTQTPTKTPHPLQMNVYPDGSYFDHESNSI